MRLCKNGSDMETKYIIIMTKEGSTKIVNFMTPGTGALMLGRGHIVILHNLRSTLSICTTLIAIVLGILMVSSAIVDFYLFFDGPLDMKI